MHEGDGIVTIEGLGSPDSLHPLQLAFVERDGFQCGYCTPGQICSAVGMLAEAEAGFPSHVTRDVASSEIPLTDDEIRRSTSTLCVTSTRRPVTHAPSFSRHHVPLPLLRVNYLAEAIQYQRRSER